MSVNPKAKYKVYEMDAATCRPMMLGVMPYAEYVLLVLQSDIDHNKNQIWIEEIK